MKFTNLTEKFENFNSIAMVLKAYQMQSRKENCQNILHISLSCSEKNLIVF